MYRILIVFLIVLSPLNAFSNDSIETSNQLPTQTFEGIVATDLASTLAQLEGLSPFSTTLQISKPKTEFGSQLVGALRQLGFALQFVSEDQGVNYIKFRRFNTGSADDVVTTFSLEIKGISVDRSFVKYKSGFIPDTPIIIEGAEAQAIDASDRVYRDYVGSLDFPTGVFFRSSLGLSEAPQKRTTGTALKSYDALRQLIVSFRPNTVELGDRNKRAIRQLIRTFDSKNQRFYITDCGPQTPITPAKLRALALKRGERIRSELKTYGVSNDRIVKVGCATAKYADALNSKSVVLTLEH